MELREFTCKCCTAPLDIGEAVGRAVRCKYCGTVFLLAREDEGKVADLLRSAELLLDTCKFDEAYTAYAKAAELDSEEPEAYFGMALAAFKVQYLKDEVNERLQPICHEISEKVFSDDKNFRRALELATDEQKREYLARAEGIDRIRKEFYALKESGLDYDCFLCTKVSDEHGGTTQDSHEAFKLYHHLKKKGYAPFYSEAETGARTGSDYEALILYALYTSECMLIVCSDEEYLQTKWVKNEYMRFLHMLANEEKERDALTFVFSGKPVEKLPSGKKVQGIDLSKPDAYTRIEDFVQTHTPAAKKRREEEAEKKDKEIAELKEQLARMKEEQAAAASPANLSPAQFVTMMREAEEKERKEKEEEEKRRREYLAQFVIKNGVLKKYNGKGGAVVIPDGVTSIDKSAFYNCNELKSIEIPNSVTSIGEWAFGACAGLEGELKISESVTSIGDGAFWNCKRLTGELKIPNGVTSIGKHAFDDCLGFTGALRIPGGVTAIGDFAFHGCSGLTNVIIPDSVTSIEQMAFGGCIGLTSLEIPSSVTSIGGKAFDGCNRLEKVTIPNRFKGLMNAGLKKIFGSNYKKIQFTFTE